MTSLYLVPEHFPTSMQEDIDKAAAPSSRTLVAVSPHHVNLLSCYVILAINFAINFLIVFIMKVAVFVFFQCSVCTCLKS